VNKKCVRTYSDLDGIRNHIHRTYYSQEHRDLYKLPAAGVNFRRLGLNWDLE